MFESGYAGEISGLSSWISAEGEAGFEGDTRETLKTHQICPKKYKKTVYLAPEIVSGLPRSTSVGVPFQRFESKFMERQRVFYG